MDKDAATEFAEGFSICCVEECNRLPVRMIVEFNNGVVDIVMLCRQHGTTYQPEGFVLSDQLLPTAELEPEVLDVQIK